MRFSLLALIVLLFPTLASGQIYLEEKESCTERRVRVPKVLKELSGLIERDSPGTPLSFWAHNDLGSAPELYGIESLGETFTVAQTITFPKRLRKMIVDLEDIALGPARGPLDSHSWIYLADTGNNSFRRNKKNPLRILRFPSSDLSSKRRIRLRKKDIEGVQLEFNLQPETKNSSFDIEAMAIEPFSGGIFFITKEFEGEAQASVYFLSAYDRAWSTYKKTKGDFSSVQVKYLGTLPLLDGERVAGADFDRNGSVLAVITDKRLLFYSSQIGRIDSAEPFFVVPLSNRNYEAVTFLRSGSLVIGAEGGGDVRVIDLGCIE